MLQLIFVNCIILYNVIYPLIAKSLCGSLLIVVSQYQIRLCFRQITQNENSLLKPDHLSIERNLTQLSMPET